MEWFKKNVDTTPKRDELLHNYKDALGIPILGKLTNESNIDLLNLSLDEERKFNDPSIAYKWVAENYMNSFNDGGIHKYRAELELTFFDIDVFRQPALHFEKHGKFCPYDPKYDKYAYATYWDTVEYRRRYGMTAYAGIDADGKPRLVHIPGNLYGFLNFAPIQRIVSTSDDGEDKFVDTDTTELSLMKLDSLVKGLQIPIRKTAKKDVFFPSFFDGQYHLIVAKNFARLIGKNFFFVKARRKGGSYFNGWDAINNIDLTPNIACILAASDKKYLTHGKGLMKMAYTYSDFLNATTDFRKGRLVSNKEHLKFGYIKQGTTEECGYKSELLAVSSKNNPDVTVGKDVYEIDFEELGKYPNFLESYGVTTSTAEAGAYKTGMLCGWGTGGTDDANWADFEKVAYSPSIVDSLVCEDIWSPEPKRGGVIYCYPHVQSLEGAMDYNGNTNFELAWHIYEEERKIEEHNTKTDIRQYERWISQRANNHDQAFTRYSANLFPITKIRAQIRRINTEPEVNAGIRHGWLFEENNRVVFKSNFELQHQNMEFHTPILMYPPAHGSDLHGCYTEYYTPMINPNTLQVPDDLVVLIQDPYAHDKDKSRIGKRDSLGATYAVQMPSSFGEFRGARIVASYVGRPPLVSTYNSQVKLMMKRWNAKLLFENMIGDTKTFMQLNGMYHMLIDELTMQFAPDLGGTLGRHKGVHIDVPRFNKGIAWLKELLEEIQHTNILTGDQYDFLYYIKDLGLLSELSKFDGERNFDRISAMVLFTFLIRERAITGITPTDEDKKLNNSIFDTAFF